MAVEVPHFSHPFTISGEAALVDEQHSEEEVRACVARIVAVEVGTREEAPTFGISDPTFEQAPVDARRLADEINRWEPRAELAGRSEVNSADELVSNVTLGPRAVA